MNTIESRIVRNFIRTAKAAGFIVDRVSDGEQRHKVAGEVAALAVVDSVDESWLYFSKEGDTSRKRESLYVVLGNGVDCLADMSCGRDDWDAVVSQSTDYCNAQEA